MKPDEIIWHTKLIGFGVRYLCRDKVLDYKCPIGNRQGSFAICKYGQPWTVTKAENRMKIIQMAKGNSNSLPRFSEPPDLPPGLAMLRSRKSSLATSQSFIMESTTPQLQLIVSLLRSPHCFRGVRNAGSAPSIRIRFKESKDFPRKARNDFCHLVSWDDLELHWQELNATIPSRSLCVPQFGF
jgi:hypothetical protein